MRTSMKITTLAALLMAAPAFAESPSPSANVSSEEAGAVGTTNSMENPVPKNPDQGYVPTQDTLDQHKATSIGPEGTVKRDEAERDRQTRDASSYDHTR